MARRIVSARDQVEMLSPWRTATTLYRGMGLSFSDDPERVHYPRFRELYQHYRENPNDPIVGDALAEYFDQQHRWPGTSWGRHWTTDRDVAENFAHCNGGMFNTVATAEWDGEGEDETGFGRGGDHPHEREVTLHPGTGLHLTDFEIANSPLIDGWNSVLRAPRRIQANELQEPLSPKSKNPWGWVRRQEREGHPYAEVWHAPLETGHHLHVYRAAHPPTSSFATYETPWFWHIRGAGDTYEGHGISHSVDPARKDDQFYLPVDDDPEYEGHATKEDAMRDAEAAYMRLVKRPDTKHAPSEIDYESIINPRDDLDEDYGDIFGDKP